MDLSDTLGPVLKTAQEHARDVDATGAPSSRLPKNMPETSMQPGPSQSRRSRGCVGRDCSV